MPSKSQRRATMEEGSEAAKARAEAAISILAGYGLPQAEEASPAYTWPHGRFEPGTYTGGIELTEAQTAWLLAAFGE